MYICKYAHPNGLYNVITRYLKCQVKIDLLLFIIYFMLIRETFCYKCNRKTHFTKKDIDQVWWLCLTILTGGFAGIIWIAKNLNKGWKCNTCGTKGGN